LKGLLNIDFLALGEVDFVAAKDARVRSILMCVYNRRRSLYTIDYTVFTAPAREGRGTRENARSGCESISRNCRL